MLSPGKGGAAPVYGHALGHAIYDRHVAMSWAQRLKRVLMGRPSASILNFVVAVVDSSKSSSMRRTVALRIRTSFPVKRGRPSTGFWLILRARNRTPPLCHTWHHRPERHLRQGELMRSIKRRCPGVHCLCSQEADPQPHISKDATEKRVARTVAHPRSGMDGYELRDHLSQQRLRPIGGYFENFYSSVSRISEEIYFQQAVYFSYTCMLFNEAGRFF